MSQETLRYLLLLERQGTPFSKVVLDFFVTTVLEWQIATIKKTHHTA